MTEAIQRQLDYFIGNREHRALRKPASDPYRFAETYRREGLSDAERAARRLEDMLAEETPVVFPWEHIAFLRTVPTLPEIHTPEEFEELQKRYYIHEQGKVCNIAPEYSLLLTKGLGPLREEVVSLREDFLRRDMADEAAYEAVLLRTIDAILDFSERYRQEALRVGNQTVADTLSRIPRQAPETFLEALQFLRIIHYCLWCSCLFFRQ